MAINCVCLSAHAIPAPIFPLIHLHCISNFPFILDQVPYQQARVHNVVYLMQFQSSCTNRQEQDFFNPLSKTTCLSQSDSFLEHSASRPTSNSSSIPQFLGIELPPRVDFCKPHTRRVERGGRPEYLFKKLFNSSSAGPCCRHLKSGRGSSGGTNEPEEPKVLKGMTVTSELAQLTLARARTQKLCDIMMNCPVK